MFDNVLLAVDLDGTLLNDESKVSERNKEAINEFRSNGGIFSIATGRATSYTRSYAIELDISVPAIVYNGGMIYDFKKDEIPWQLALPRKSIDYVIDFYKKFPTLGIDVMKGEDIYSISSNYQSKQHEIKAGVPLIKCDIDDLPIDNWNKILLIDEKEIIDLLFEYSSTIELDGIHITRSSPYYFEILPCSANKGTALRKMIELCGFDKHYTVTAGDFNNDIEMLQEADLGIAVRNAQDEVKKHADLIVCDNNSGAIYEIVEFLKSNRTI